MAYYPATPFVPQFLTDAGVPLSGGTITAYLADTTTPTNMYIDDAGTSAGPVITLNARGEPQVSGNTVVIWLDTAVRYKFVLKDASSVSKWAINDIADAAALLRTDLANTSDTSLGDALVGVKQPFTGAVARTQHSKNTELVSISDFGAVIDGVTDDRAAIQAGIDYLSTSGGGVLFFPPGTVLIGNNGSGVGIDLKSNVTLVGSGSSSIIKLKNSADAHLVVIAASAEYCRIYNLLLDGNRANQTAGVHCLRVGGCFDLIVQNITVKNAATYGIGIQAGSNRRIIIDNAYIFDTGGDCIDIKNMEDDNENIFLSNITAKSWGNNGALTVQAAIDCRGPVRLNNIWISAPVAADAVGLRFREGELLDPSGYGAHRSSATNFDIRMGAGASQVGLYNIARDVTVANGYISGGLFGVLAQEADFRASNVTVEGASGDGFSLETGGGYDASRAVLTGCHASDCGVAAFDISSDNVQINSCFGYDSAFGLRIQASAANTRVTGGRYQNNSSFDVTDAGTNNTFIDVIDYVTTNYVESGSIAVDSTGHKTATIAHGLDFTPDPKKCSIVQIRETAVTDFEVGYYNIVSVTSTNIVVGVRIVAASATVGATIKLGVTAKV